MHQCKLEGRNQRFVHTVKCKYELNSIFCWLGEKKIYLYMDILQKGLYDRQHRNEDS